ncbi:MAG TPA: hypothetical protein VF483_02370, partial [Gemmatimonadaceae bacterium]
ALGARVTDPVRDAKYEVARVKIANAAMIPSRVWGDTSAWTSATASRRTLLVSGHYAAPRYRLDAVRVASLPTQPAESRHIINLNRLSEDAYSWDTEVVYALGSAPANEIEAFTRVLFASGEGRYERDVRADYNAVAPRTTAALSQFFIVDSIRTALFADSSTLATFAVTMRPDFIQARLPRFAEYARKYLVSAKTRWTLTDRNGGEYLSITGDEGHITMQVRTRRGQIVSMNGPVVPLPDTLTLNGMLVMKVRHFTMGFRDYHAEFTFIRTEHESSWNIISRREPDWVLPLGAERLLRTPLRRPFQGSGSLFRIGVRDSVGGQTVLLRRLHLEVQESAILRFIGRLGSTAMGDYQGHAEQEMDVWLADVFAGITADLAAMGGSCPGTRHSALGTRRKLSRSSRDVRIPMPSSQFRVPSSQLRVPGPENKKAAELCSAARGLPRHVIGTLRPTEQRRALSVVE